MPRYAQQPQLLSHFIHELLLFDTSLRDEWGYDGGNSLDGWKGLTGEVLGELGYFSTWLDVERNCIFSLLCWPHSYVNGFIVALSRYESILAAPDARKLDTDSVSSNDTKPTNATVRINDLLEAVTEIYRPLTDFSQRLEFFIKIQLDIFDAYHRRLSDALQAYNISTSAVARRIHGSTAQKRDSKEDLKGMSALESLMRVYGSAEFLESKMADWSDDVFFVDMYEELQDRVASKKKIHNPKSGSDTRNNIKDTIHSPVASTFTVPQIAERTSSTLKNDDEDDNNLTHGALFDEITASYRSLRLRAEDFITSLLTSSLSDGLRAYTRINTWSSLSSNPSSSTSPTSITDSLSDTSVPPQLDTFLQTLSSYLSYLSPILATAPLRRIGRQLALSIQDVIWNQVIDSRSFSESGAMQLKRDVLAIWGVMDRYLGFGQGEQGMRRVGDGLRLLGLGSAGQENSARGGDFHDDGDDDDDDLSAWDEGGQAGNHDRAHGNGPTTTTTTDSDQKETTPGVMTLETVASRLFHTDNGNDDESANDILRDLGIETLTIVEARGVIQRRVELGR